MTTAFKEILSAECMFKPFCKSSYHKIKESNSYKPANAVIQIATTINKSKKLSKKIHK